MAANVYNIHNESWQSDSAGGDALYLKLKTHSGNIHNEFLQISNTRVCTRPLLFLLRFYKIMTTVLPVPVNYIFAQSWQSAFFRLKLESDSDSDKLQSINKVTKVQ